VSRLFQVTVDAKGVSLEKLKRGKPGFRQAKKRAILRQRDAIELFQRIKKARAATAGRYSFHFLDTARTFALLQLQARQAALQENLDRILAYDG